MLSELSGPIHQVLTGVCICYKDNKYTFQEETEVKLIDLSEDLKNWHLETEEPMEQAGGYNTCKGRVLSLLDRWMLFEYDGLASSESSLPTFQHFTWLTGSNSMHIHIMLTCIRSHDFHDSIFFRCTHNEQL